jgi:hypothetical protein
MVRNDRGEAWRALRPLDFDAHQPESIAYAGSPQGLLLLSNFPARAMMGLQKKRE